MSNKYTSSSYQADYYSAAQWWWWFESANARSLARVNSANRSLACAAAAALAEVAWSDVRLISANLQCIVRRPSALEQLGSLARSRRAKSDTLTPGA